MSRIKDIAYVRYQAPDLTKMQSFLEDFGMNLSARTDSALYMRGRGEAPCIHITELGNESRGVGVGLQVRTATDLRELADQLGAKVQPNTEPGGGQVVTVKDPAGFRLDLIHGQDRLHPLPTRASTPVNNIDFRTRRGRFVRLNQGPANVMRLGHAVMVVPDFQKSFDFYTQVLGFKPSDFYYMESKDKPMFSFLHVGSGTDYTDHHTIAIGSIGPPIARFDHTAFEVLDWDDIITGQEYLRQKQHKHSWGVGRHILGSQIFDYWRDPFGNKIEHFTDGDLVNDQTETGYMQLDMNALHQWAPPLNPEFFE